MSLQTFDLSFSKKDFKLGPLNLSFPEKTVTYVRGRNGSGKTTLLKLLCGKLKPEVGHVEGQIYPMGVIGIGGIFFRTWTLFENFQWFGQILKRSIPLEDLEPWKNHRIHELSTGILRRAELKFLLAGSFPLCLLDEPFGPLDVSSRQSFYEILFEQLKKRATVILTTHFDENLTGKADQIIDL